MKLESSDVAILTEWAAKQKRHRIIATIVSPTLPLWWLLTYDSWTEISLCTVVITFLIGMLLHGYILSGLVLWAPGPGSFNRILAGANPSVTLEAVVHCDNGADPFPITVRLVKPIHPGRAYLHVSPDLGLRVGQQLIVHGFGSPRNPFRHTLLLTHVNGRDRHWLRIEPTVSERYEEPRDD